MTLLEMSLTGAVLTAVAACARPFLLHRLPKGTMLALWLLALARFLLPVAPPCPLSVYSFVVSHAPAEAASLPPQSLAMPEARPPATAMQTAAVPAPALSARFAFPPLLALVWAAGAIGCALFFTVVSVRCRREFRTSLPAEEPQIDGWLAAHPLLRRVSARVSDRISAPLTFGLLRPVILLPAGFDCDDAELLDCVLTHEWVHIRRCDGLTKLLIAAAVCLHWWNPLAWVLYALFNRDLELACDEAVVRRCGKPANYARALIRLEERKSGLVPFCSSFNRSAMEERIFAIMKMKKTTRRTAAISAAAVFAVGALFATSAAVEPLGEAFALPDGQTGDGVPAYLYPVEKVDWNGERELLESFEPFGISYDSDGKMYFQGERVRWFWDGYEIWEDGKLLGWSMRYEYLDREGTVDARTLHSVIDNGDGSVDPYGPLIDIVPYSQEEFDSRTYESIRRNAVEATTIDDDAVLVEDEARPGSGSAAPVSAVQYQEVTGAYTDGGACDELLVQEGERMTFSGDFLEPGSADGAAYTVREDAELTRGSADTVAASAEGNSASKGRTFAEIFAAYRDYGITYREKNGVREVFYHGEPVAHFADLKPNGSAFSFDSGSAVPEGLTVQTVYDEAGNLTGLKTGARPES